MCVCVRVCVRVFVNIKYYPTDLWNIPEMADSSNRDGGSWAPTAEEKHIGGL